MAYFFIVHEMNSQHKDIDEETKLMIKMLGVTAIIPLAATFSRTSEIVPRLLMYFTFVQFVVIAKTLDCIRLRLVKYVAYILYFFIFFYQFYISDNSRIFDFKLIFE